MQLAIWQCLLEQVSNLNFHNYQSRIWEYKTFQWTTNSPNTLESSFRYKGTHSPHLLSVANNDNQYLQLAAFREMINYVC